MTRRILLLVAVVFAFVATIANVAVAQDYPNRLIKLIAPSQPGGPSEVVIRTLADRMSTALGQTVIVENRPGAGGAIGARAVVAAPPDGYTLLVSAPGALVVTSTLYKNPGYYPEKDLTPVATTFSSPQMLVGHPTFPVKSIADIVVYAKANPGKLNYASPFYGTAPHLLGELFRISNGIDIVNVRYKGGAESVMGMLSGQTHIGFEIVPLLLGHIQAGKLNAIAVADATRSKQLPDVPTTVEAGFPDLQATLWIGVMAPAGTPPDIVTKLNATINTIMTASDMAASLDKLGARPKVGTVAEVTAFMAAERKKWGDVIRAAGISID